MTPSDFRRRLDAEHDAVDSGTGHPVPGTPRWDAQFGRGWTSGCVITMLGFLAGGIYAVASQSAVGRVRGLAFAVGSFASGFLFAMFYLCRYGIGFGLQSDVVWPDDNPIKYRMAIGAIVVFSVGVLVAAIATVVHASDIAPHLR